MCSSSARDSLEARLARIESKLDSLRPSSAISLTNPLDKQNPSDGSSPDLLDSGQGGAVALTPDSPGDSGPIDLLPLHEIMPVVESYFTDFNSVVPLFHQSTFLKLLHTYYSGTTQRSRVVWATINCVLAIGYRVSSIDSDPIRHSLSERRSQECVSNAQKVLDELIMRDEDTLGVQCILAMVIIHNASPNHRPASVLIGTAVRLAHRLQLHSRYSHSTFSPDEAKHRDNTFWICYFLDKDISLRTKTPSVQLDIDIDLDLPGSAGANGEGELRSLDGLSRFNYFRAKVQLAHLQGKIYDNLYSVRSRKLTPDERKQRVIQLDTMVDEWRRTIPTPLQLEHMAQSLARAAVVHMTVLQHQYLLNLVMIHGLYSMDSGWMQAIGELGRATLEGFDNNTEICMKHMPMGAYFSGLVILLANILYFPTHELVMQDRKLANDGMKLLAHTTLAKQDEHFVHMDAILRGLEIIADKALGHYQMHPDETPDPPANVQGNYPQPPLDLFGEDLGNDYVRTTPRSQLSLIDLGADMRVGQLANGQLPGDMPIWPNEPTFDAYNLDPVGFDTFDERATALFTDRPFRY
ncbi:fungal-specific transcription factor domain-containing protein [Xylariales sp. AK1849]|nr:fungal-specific transcription factor domain-containing protein [Xylariales sp. AK1849]